MSENEDRAQAQYGHGRHGRGRHRRVADRYLLLRELGRGGMGVVWLAMDEFLRREVAVKELRPPPGLTGQELDVLQHRALQEARSAARIHHPNAVTLYEAIPASGQDNAMYLIMEFVEGPTLAQLVTHRALLPSPQVAAFGLQLLDVLRAAHALGIVHRDVKPGNILIAANDRVKLADFGIAHTMGDARLTRSGVMGTQAYQAPELFESVPITPAVDLWSLGSTLYYAAEGRGPFDRDSTGATLRAIVLDDLPVPRCEAHLATVITHLLQRDPAERATIDQAYAELQRVPAQEPPPPADSRQLRSAMTQPSGTSTRNRQPTWDPGAETRRRPAGSLPPDLAPEAARKRTPGRRYLSRTAITIAAVVVVAVGGAFGYLAAVGGSGTPKGIHRLHPTISSGSANPRSAPAPSPLSEDTTGRTAVFVNGSEQIGEDYYASGWHGPDVLPGTPQAGSPVVVSLDGTRILSWVPQNCFCLVTEK